MWCDEGSTPRTWHYVWNWFNLCTWFCASHLALSTHFVPRLSLGTALAPGSTLAPGSAPRTRFYACTWFSSRSWFCASHLVRCLHLVLRYSSIHGNVHARTERVQVLWLLFPVYIMIRTESQFLIESCSPVVSILCSAVYKVNQGTAPTSLQFPHTSPTPPTPAPAPESPPVAVPSAPT